MDLSQHLGRDQTCASMQGAALQMFTAFGDALLGPLPLETQTQFRRLFHNIGNALRGVQQAYSNGFRQIVSAALVTVGRSCTGSGVSI